VKNNYKIMANKRKGRLIKTILGQSKTEQPITEITEETKPLEESDLSDLQRVMDAELPIYPDDRKIDGEREVEPELEAEINELIDEDYDDEDEIPVRTMDSLSKSELRWYQRTGKMPK